MRARQWMQIAAVVSTVGLTGNAIAQNPATTAPLGQTPATEGVGGNNQTKAFPPLDNWMNDYAGAHDGRITRQEFMDQMNNRWNMLDNENRGYLTPDQARGIYSTGRAPPLTGSQVSPGYMGPGNAKK